MNHLQNGRFVIVTVTQCITTYGPFQSREIGNRYASDKGLVNAIVCEMIEVPFLLCQKNNWCDCEEGHPDQCLVDGEM